MPSGLEQMLASFGMKLPDETTEGTKTVASWHASSQPLHLRKWHRVSWDVPLLLHPLRDDLAIAGEPFLVRGRDVSLGGISFRHADPLPCKSVKLVYAADSRGEMTFHVRLNWCRFTRLQCYLSGGRFFRP